MAKYEYDESGATFYYFLLSLALMLVLPSTYSLASAAKDRTKSPACNCAACVRKTQLKPVVDRRSTLGRINKKTTFTVLGWVAIVFLSYLVYTTEAPTVEVWDPFKILGLEHSADMPEIKKMYRTLSKTLHPDKVSEDEKDAANERWTEIVKAYTALTNEDLRKNFEEFGHPDGRQAMTFGIALPTWMVEGQNSYFVLSLYGLGFGFLLPFLVGRWWYSARRYTKDRILNRTMGTYFKQLKETTSLRQLIEVVASADEFKEDLPSGVLANGDRSDPPAGKMNGSKSDALSVVTEAVAAELERRGEKAEKWKKGTPYFAHRATVLLIAHLLRISVDDRTLLRDQSFIVCKSVYLLHGLLQITAARGWLHQSLNCMTLSQMLVQALWSSDSPLMQLPHITSTSEVLKHAKTKKRDIRTIENLMAMPVEERKSLLRSLSEEEQDDVQRVAALYPSLTVVKADFKVAGDQAITPGAIVQFVCRLRLRRPGEEDSTISAAGEAGAKVTVKDVEEDDDEDEDHPVETAEARRRRKAEESQDPLPVHAPYFLGAEKKPGWWITLGETNRNRTVVPPAKFGDLETERTFKIQFQAPPSAGVYAFKAFFKSDAYAGVDVVKEVKLVIQEPSVLPEEPEIEDDISEPDEDSIAGQMELLRKQGVAGALAGGSGSSAAGAANKDDDGDSDSDSDSSDDDSD